MLPVFLDKLKMWLLSLCAKAVGLGSAIDGCLHSIDGLKVFVFPKHLSRSGAVLETFLVLFQLFAELYSSESIPAENVLKYIVYPSHMSSRALMEMLHSELAVGVVAVD